MQLRTATDFALRATKVTARSLGKAMSTMVVQERHLWLNLAEMKDVDKARFLNVPISQAGLFGDTVECFVQQFSAVQQQTEAIQHILPWRDAPSTAAPGARPQSARRRGHPPASSRAAPPQAESTHRPVRRASRRRAVPPPPSQPGPKSSRKSTKRPWRGQPGDVGVCSLSGDGKNSAAPSPGGGPGGESSVSFCFCSAAGPHPGAGQSCSRRALTTAHVPRRVATPSRDDPADLESIRGSSGRPVCLPRVLPLPAVLLPDRGPPRHRRTGTQLASGLTQVCVFPSEPTRTDTVQAQGGRGAGPAGCAPLAHPDLVSRTHFPRDSTSLVHSSEEGPPLSGARHHMAPASRSMEPPCVAPGWSRWTQSSWSSCLLRQRIWPRSLPSNGSGTSRRFR